MDQPFQDLQLLLQDLLCPPGVRALPVVMPGFAELPDKMPGALVLGNLSREEWGRLMDALLPGACVALAPGGLADADACMAEDAGFEVRDAIFVSRTAGELLFSPKASRKEREEGLSHLPVKKGHEAVRRRPDTAGIRSARAGAGRSAKEVRNFHPTCKPVSIMTAILHYLNVVDGPVVDPFAGTGTTGVACVRAGIPAICIEQDPQFAEIGLAKVRDEELKRPG